jgi:hypothetical protein
LTVLRTVTWRIVNLPLAPAVSPVRRNRRGVFDIRQAMLRRGAVYGATGGEPPRGGRCEEGRRGPERRRPLKLAEIDRRLEHDPTIARPFRRCRRIPGSWPGQPSARCWPT